MARPKQNLLIKLYKKYADELKEVRKSQREVYSNLPLPLFDDFEAEIVYMLIREYKPGLLCEIGRGNGWTTSWIARALKKNDYGVLLSYDLYPPLSYFPDELRGFVRFYTTNVQENTTELFSIKDSAFLLIDAEHSGKFAEWYCKELLPNLSPTTWVVIHDMVDWFKEERDTVFNYLTQNNIAYLSVCSQHPVNYFNEVKTLRDELCFDGLIHSGSIVNPSVFFRKGEM